jgi:glycerate 2-kinase
MTRANLLRLRLTISEASHQQPSAMRESTMAKIKNADELLRNAGSTLDRKARKLTIEALNAALRAVDPKAIIKRKVTLKGNLLKIGNLAFDLNDFRNIYVVGGGKASGAMAEALVGLLGERIKEGAVNVPYASPSYETGRVKLQPASHPIPDESGVKGAKRMLEMVGKAEKSDLVFCLISGGGSSLMPQPRGGISLEDKRKVTDALLKCGATITEINTVRKHISELKGGWLAKEAYPATVVNLILSDVVGDPLDFIASGPTVPDTTTFHDAVEILKRYGLWSEMPGSVRKVLSDGEKGLIPETPKLGDEVFRKVHNIVVGNNFTASEAAYETFRKAKINTVLLTTTLEGQAKDVGTVLASMAREIVASGNPVSKPAALVAGGETTVTVMGKGKGGRNQEIALGAALKIGKMGGVVVASISTDGVDGPTDAAGAVVDGRTLQRAHDSGLKPREYLANNDSYMFFSKLGDLVFTDPTGTNVCDVAVVVVL